MNTTEFGLPSAKNYLEFSDADLLKRLHGVAAGNRTMSENERALIYNILTLRAQSRSNLQNRRLVYATWALVIVAIAVPLLPLPTNRPASVQVNSRKLLHASDLISEEEWNSIEKAKIGGKATISDLQDLVDAIDAYHDYRLHGIKRND